MKKVITSRFSDELVRKVDRAVLRGRFRSRSEALRAMVEEYFIGHPELFEGEGTQELLAKAETMWDDELERLGSRLFKEASAVGLVAEGRR